MNAREASFLRFCNLFAPLSTFAFYGCEAVKEETHGAGEDAFDLLDGVTSVNEILERGDDG